MPRISRSRSVAGPTDVRSPNSLLSWSIMVLLDLVVSFGIDSISLRHEERQMASATMKKLTPVLFVGEIEPCLEFWTRLGFERTAEVPEGDRLGFVLLTKD